MFGKGGMVQVELESRKRLLIELFMRKGGRDWAIFNSSNEMIEFIKNGALLTTDLDAPRRMIPRITRRRRRKELEQPFPPNSVS